MNVFELAAKLTLDSSEYEKGLKGASSEAHQFGQRLNGGINKLLKIGAAAAGAAVAGVVAFSKAAVNTGMQFDTAMSQVAATMGVTTDQIQELRDYAQKMGATTAFSATQAAQALNYMALAGYDAETSMSMLPNVLNLAAAGSMDLARASDMLTDSQSALGLTVDETNELVDKMAQTASKANTSVEQLGDAILTVGGTAKNLNGGTTELATALGILADNGVKGAEGGTALRNIILALSAPTETASKKLDELGVSVYDAEGNMRGLNEIFGDLDESMSGLTQEQRMEALATIFNNRDLKSAEALLANYGLRWDELSGYIDDAAGAAEKMAETQLDNLNGDLTLMNSALEGAKIAFSDGITPALRNLVQMVTKALSNPKTTKFLKEAGEKIGEVATKLAQLAGGLLTRVINLFKNGAPQVKAFAASFGALVVAIKAYSAASKLAANGTTLITTAIKFMSSPLGAVVTALGALTAVLGAVAVRASRTAKSYSTLTKAQRENLDAALELADAYDDSSEDRAKALIQIDTETERTRALWEELQTLVDENGRLIGSKDRAREITDELNSSLGTEFAWEDDLLSNYKEQSGAIDTLIQKRRAMRQLEVAEQAFDDAAEKLPEIREGIYEAETDIARLQQQSDAAWADYLETRAVYDQLVASGADLTFADDGSSALGRYAGLQNELAQRQQELDELRGAEQQALNDQQDYYNAYEEYANGHYDEVSNILDKDVDRRLIHKAETEQLNSDELSELIRSRDIAQRNLERYLSDVESGTVEYSERTEKQLQETLDKYNDAIEQQTEAAGELGSATPEALVAGENIVKAFVEGMYSKSGLVAFAASHLSSVAARNLNSGGGEGPGHAGGLDYVPYDNYSANLHRGEAVLTAREAEEWRRGEGSGRQIVNNFTFNGVSQSDLDMIVAYVNRGVVMG